MVMARIQVMLLKFQSDLIDIIMCQRLEVEWREVMEVGMMNRVVDLLLEERREEDDLVDMEGEKMADHRGEY